MTMRKTTKRALSFALTLAITLSMMPLPVSVLAAADSIPTAAAIKAQGTALAKGTGPAAASTNTAALSGLTALTSYRTHVVAEDAALLHRFREIVQ